MTLAEESRRVACPARVTRSLLFVPASRPDMMAKAARSAADAVCLDLEDSVAPSEKAASRGHVIRALQQLDFGPRVHVMRMNGLEGRVGRPRARRDA